MATREFEVKWTLTGSTVVSAYDLEDAKERVEELYISELLDISDTYGPEIDEVEEV